MAAAIAVRSKADSILAAYSKSNILIMGDLNDTYNSKTLTVGLKVRNDYADVCNTALYNLSASLAKAGKGSIKYRNRWQLVDMFLVSGNLLDTASKPYCTPDDVSIYDADFLIEYMPASNTYRPKPTYRWINYIGGYSDHLPVLMIIYKNH